MKYKKTDKRLAAAKYMPFEYHTIPGKPFDICKSEALDWLLEQPEIRRYVWDRIVQSGYIHYDRESRTWVGVDYDS